MGMLGNPADNSLRRVANDSFNGDNSTVAFTLSAAVNNTTDIEVLVDNVQQSPYDGSYSVSGTTLTFSAAPATGTNNIYVIYHVGRTSVVGEAVPQDASVTPAKLDRSYIPGTTVEGAMTTQFGRRNLIINGAMQVWQRGQTYTPTTYYAYGAADRWSNNSLNTTYSRDTDVPAGFKYSLKIAGSSAGYPGTTYRIEGKDCVHLVGQSVTISAWIKKTTGNTSVRAGLFYAGSEDNFGTLTSIADPNIATTPTSSWVRYSVTINNLPSQVTNGIQLTIFTFGSPSSDVMLITGVQLEVGSVATPFEHRIYGEEMRLCQRYYTSYGGPNPGYWHFIGVTDASYLHISSGANFPTEMRAAPSVTIFSGSGDGYVDAYGRGQYGQGNAGTTEVTQFGFNTVSLQAGGGSATGNAGALMRGGYRADAEL